MAGPARSQEVQGARQMQEESERVVIHPPPSIADIAIDRCLQVGYRNYRFVLRASSI
jgi:hypothetical protein